MSQVCAVTQIDVPPAVVLAGPNAARLLEIAQISRTSIDSYTGLSTDFLNQYNEVAMPLEMAAEWPDGLADLKGWQPRDYRQHFARSGFRDSALVLEAYGLCPMAVRVRFDAVSDSLNKLILVGLEALEDLEEAGVATDHLCTFAVSLGNAIRAMITGLDRMVHGASLAAASGEHALADAGDEGLDQSAIDSLFD
jgi:hypothetical protein